MAAYLITNEPKQSLSLKEYKKTVSTLRIPTFLESTFFKGIKRHGSLPKYFSHIVKKYRFLFYANELPFSKKVKTEYQERGTEIFIKTFRPELKDWIEMGMWASALNFSICKLFAILLIIEKEKESIVNERIFLYMAVIVTTPHNLRVPRLVKVLRKGRNILERGITFYDPPE